MIALKIFVIGVGAICLLSLAIYVWLARTGNSLTLYLTFDHRLLSVKQKVFLIFSAIGLLVCLYQGASAMLFWLPDKWSRFDSDGGYQTIKASLSALFAMLVGLPLFGFIDEAARQAHFFKAIRERAEGLEKIVGASGRADKLDELAREFEEKIKTLSAEDKTKRGLPKGLHPHSSPEAHRISNYRQLLALANDQKSKITSS